MVAFKQGPSPRFLMAAFSLCLPMMEGARDLSGTSFLRNTPIQEGSPLAAEALPKGPPNTLVLGELGFQLMDMGPLALATEG